MSKLHDDARWLVDRITAGDAAIKALSKPQLGTSSIETGSIEEYDVEGTLMSVTGQQFDGTHGTVTVAGPIPPEPAPPSLTVGTGQVEVRWSGKFLDEATSPMDFSHVSVHVSELEVFTPDNDTQRATITGESGDLATVLLDSGEWYFLLVAVSKAGKWSDPSETVLAEVADVLSPDAILDELINIDEKFTDVDRTLAEVQISVDGKTSIHNSIEDAPAGEFAEGDHWQKWTTLDVGGKLLASWRYTAGAWVAESMDPTYLPKIDIGAGTFGQLVGGRLVAGTITAPLLETKLVLTTDIIAGNPAGTHAKMNASGFRALASTDGNAPTEVIRMGTDTDDYFGVVNAGGKLVASITSGGDFSGQSGDFANDISIAGTSILETIAALPKGLAAWASRATNSLYWAGTAAQPYLHLQFDAEPGRAYMVQTNPISIDSDTANVEAVVYLQYEEDGSPATNSSPVIARGTSAQASASTRRTPVVINRLITPPPGPVSLLISYGTISTGRAKIVATPAGQSVVMTVTDIGASPPMTGEIRNGTSDAATGGTGGGSTAPPPTPVKNYDKTWSATGMRSFIGSGAVYDYNPQYMYSGQSPAGYGDLSSMAIFPNLTGELSGATITAMWVYVYYDFWYQGSGGAAYIGFHGQTGLTGSRPAKTYSHALSANWPRAAGRWVPINSSTFAGWKAGTHRGITLGGSGGGYERYGYAHDARIRIKYTK
ncbi:hypothetical protein AL755_08465 [Arthrobacter sp. ERGS1:01]|uniref:hypothetical protein n=1 Tax=Arthrobacter sp. ERGS1:01 TaxID=1704044 RepID=UPI0006B6682E|nr:hypothetical protein [Arthrobacter sp. ERGS1:01]ALE05504.1 hypothetical protein AL755_08465 [Arthrobacter sp. ERGS1:01]